jgi:nanoRNase/pAp phosphatase (c-di-AMP/oligoRNAs hydrolase)
VACNVHAGHLLSKFNGGGHFGAAACTIDYTMAEKNIPLIIGALQANLPHEH